MIKRPPLGSGSPDGILEPQWHPVGIRGYGSGEEEGNSQINPLPIPAAWKAAPPGMVFCNTLAQEEGLWRLNLT